MPADAAQVATLARRLRSKGQSDAQVRTGLKGLGFNGAQTDRAMTDIGSSAPAASPARPTAGGRPPGVPAAPVQPPGAAPATSTPPAGGGGPSMPSMPSFSPPDLSAVTLTPPKSINSTDLGGFLAGIFLYTLALNYLQYGPDGVKGWLSAKFLNRPIIAAAPSVGGSSSTSKSRSSVKPAGLTSTKVGKPTNV